MPAILQKISTEWFLFEPALFAALFSHKLVANTHMSCLFRVGKMRLEYNPELLAVQTDEEVVEQYLRYEMIRILLGHPYMRQPINAKGQILTLASNCTIIDNIPQAAKCLAGAEFNLAKGLSFEEYYALLNRDSWQEKADEESGEPNDKSSCKPKDESSADESSEQADEGENSDNDEADSEEQGRAINVNEPKLDDTCENRSNDSSNTSAPDGRFGNYPITQVEQLAEQSELWEEDSLSQEALIEIIGSLSSSESWGTLTGNMIELIKSTTVVKIDYRRILSLFRASVLSSKRHLTRMLPSRRYGFECMGSKRDLMSRLLVAIDVSGSMSTDQISKALAVVNRAFKYGVEAIDVIHFDTQVYDEEPLKLKKAIKELKVRSRGGTCFQPVIDYCHSAKDYDGLIIVTDGYAPMPTLPQGFSSRILWIIDNEEAYRSPDRYTLPSRLEHLATFPRSRYMIMPRAE